MNLKNEERVKPRFNYFNVVFASGETLEQFIVLFRRSYEVYRFPGDEALSSELCAFVLSGRPP